MEAYTALGSLYEYLTREEYLDWASYILNIVNENAKGKTGWDVACGTGFFTRALKKQGYKMTGVDKSADMLREAIFLSQNERLDIPYLRQDMTALKTFEKLDFITVINDAVNYLPPEKLEKTFLGFKKALKKGGFLYFDISSEHKLKNVIGNNLFGEDDEKVSYLWFNTLNERSVTMELVFFIKAGNAYIKKEEHHEQFIHEAKNIEKSLYSAGFNKVIARPFGLEKNLDKPNRIEFLAFKE